LEVSGVTPSFGVIGFTPLVVMMKLSIFLGVGVS